MTVVKSSSWYSVDESVPTKIVWATGGFGRKKARSERDSDAVLGTSCGQLETGSLCLSKLYRSLQS